MRTLLTRFLHPLFVSVLIFTEITRKRRSLIIKNDEEHKNGNIYICSYLYMSGFLPDICDNFSGKILRSLA